MIILKNNIMVNFKQLPMAAELLSHKNIRVVSTMLGLSKQLVYIPTGATVNVKKINYNPEAISHLERVIESEGKGLAAAVKACRVQKLEIGNIELDACISADKQFLALQLLQFMDYTYQPITKVAIYEGEEAQFVSTILD